jgi:hypothetical protein
MRLWREEGLRVPPRKRKLQRLGESTVPAKRLRAERPKHVWALGFQFDTSSDGPLKLPHCVDEHPADTCPARQTPADCPTSELRDENHLVSGALAAPWGGLQACPS